MATTYYSLQHRHPDHERWVEVGRFPTDEVAGAMRDALVAHGHGAATSFRIELVNLRG